jgi:ATP-binding cassette subfamily F protein uup
MTLLKLESICLAYGPTVILDRVNFSLQAGERVALIGRNGTGKSSLLKILARKEPPDDGSIWSKPGIRVALLAQTPPAANDQSVRDTVAAGLTDTLQLLRDYEHLSQKSNHDRSELARLEQLHAQIDHVQGWQWEQQVDDMLSRLQLDGNASMSALSGGEKRRVALAQMLVAKPDVLLLDEPTNHLDIPTIEWLEKLLLDFTGSLLFITHDRNFLQTLATRIIELDRGLLTSWDCNYPTFVERKQKALTEEERHNALFDKKLAQEEAWIRQGVKARRTRNEGRVRALYALRAERAQRREQLGRAEFGIDAGALGGKLIAEADNISYQIGDRLLIDGFSTRILRGDRIGLIGRNGAGKTTLLNLLLGTLKPQRGHMRLGSNLQIAYFDQMRQYLNPDKTALDNLSEGRESITVNGKTKHIIGYLGDFLFTPERARTKVRSLSGGECNRLLLACLFSKPANVLVLDEPTNDLDMETLELLEEILLNYEGTVLLVSHDREFLDNAVTSVLVFETDGLREYTGGYSDWLRQGRSLLPSSGPGRKIENKASELAQKPQPKSKKLSYKLQRELDGLPALIEGLELKISELQQQTADAGFYRQPQTQVEQTLRLLADIQQQHEQAMQRWLELEQAQS